MSKGSIQRMLLAQIRELKAELVCKDAAIDKLLGVLETTNKQLEEARRIAFRMPECK